MVGQHLDGLPHFAHRFPHVPQLRQTHRTLVVRHAVGRVARERLAVFPRAILIVSDHSEAEATSAKAFALRHPVQISECLLDVLLCVVGPAQVPGHHSWPLIPETKLRIDFDGLQIALSCVLELAFGLCFHSRRVVTDHVEGTGRQTPHREELRGLRNLVAKCRAHVSDEPGGDVQYIVLCRSARLPLHDDCVLQRLRGLH